jgi:guanylate kinase
MKHLEKTLGLQKLRVFSTRPMRANESQGDPYTFISPEKFNDLERTNSLFDSIRHANNCYAADKGEIYRKDQWVIDILPDSWPKYRKIPGVIGIHLISPDKEVLRDRAVNRQESAESIQMRLAAIKDENPLDYDFAIPPQPTLEDLCHLVEIIVRPLFTGSNDRS